MESIDVCGICSCQIKENTFFSGLTEKQIEDFKELISTTRYNKKEVIYMEGDDCLGLYIIRVGRIKLIRASRSGKEQIINILGPGDLLGIEAFHKSQGYTNTAIAMDEADLCYMDREQFFKLIQTESDISSRLIMALGRELDHAYERIGNLGLMSAKEKLAHLICSLSKEYGISENGNIRLRLELSRMEIAELLGITQETSIRLLKSFKEEGLLDIEKKDIVIKRLDELKELGGISN